MKCTIRQIFLFILQVMMVLLLLTIVIDIMTLNAQEEGFLMNELKFMGGRECTQSIVPLRHPHLSVPKYEDPIECDIEDDWVQVIGSIAHITAQAKRHHGHIICCFTDIFQESSCLTFDGTTTQTSSSYKLTKTDSVRVNCTARTGKKWQGVLAGIRQDIDVVRRAGLFMYPLSRKELGVDVLVWCIHGLSHNMFAHLLPLTQSYLHEALGAIDMMGFNVVGKESADTLLAALTGHRAKELERKVSYASHVAVYPFLWGNFRAHGYVTALVQDRPLLHNHAGVYVPPVDHSLESFFLAARADNTRHKKHCIGSVPQHKVMMEYVLNFFQVYQIKPKFLFGSHSELSYDSYGNVNEADQDMMEWLAVLQHRGHLNNTLLVIMSDHGPKSTQFGDSLESRLEERMPLLSIVIPAWVQSAYPNLMKNLHLNSKRLTTPFDIHATILNILTFEGTGMGDNWDRGISLFKEVPLSRTCHDATLTPQWCTCLAREVSSSRSRLVAKGVQHVVDTMNMYTENYRNVCAIMSVMYVGPSVRLKPHVVLLHSPSGILQPWEEIYHVMFKVEPEYHSFEAEINYNFKNQNFSVLMWNILRKSSLNPNCTKRLEEHLHKYCICKK